MKARRFSATVGRHLPGLQQAGSSLAGFGVGLLLSFLYGMMTLYIQNYSLRDCLITTSTLSIFTAFGMGLSTRVRANVTLMLPMLCSSKTPTVFTLDEPNIQ